jgi:DNA-binding LytR/AlgR family response regulator
MDAIRVLIVEDKVLIAEDIAATLTSAGMISVGMCATGEEAIQLAKDEIPDIIIMDIQLAGAMDGISTAQAIMQAQNTCVIYLTEYTDRNTIDRAKRTYPANFLSKPFSPEELIRAVDLAVNNANRVNISRDKNQNTQNLFVRTDNQIYVKVPLISIIYLKAGRAYCTLVTDEREYILSNSLGHYHEQLNKDFIRVHRSYVVNLNRITGLDGNVVKLGKHNVSTTKDYREELTRFVKILK